MRVARYLRIADDVRDRIVAGTYPPGERLPSNRELAAAYGTTLATLRAALQLLADQGWVRVEHGNGTFVADVGVESDMLASLAEQTGEGDLVTRVIGVEEGVDDPTVARLLEVTRSASLVRLDRVRVVGEQPAVFQSSFLAGRHRHLLRGYDGGVPLYRHLRDRAGQVPAHSREVLTAVALPAEVTAVLDQRPGVPVLYSRRVSSSHDGTPIVVDDAYVLTAVLDLTIERHGRATAAGFRRAGGDAAAGGSSDGG